MSATIRAFLAIPLPSDTRAALLEIQRTLAGARADVRWTNVDHIHLTLHFFAALTSDDVSAVQAALREVTARHRPFTLQPTGLGAFPDVRAPRVLWVGIGEGRDPLLALHQELATAIRRLGLAPEDRAFHPHLTLGRVRAAHRLRLLIPRLHAPTPPLPPVPATGLTLFQSTLTPAGPVYAVLAEAPLSGPSAPTPSETKDLGIN